MLIVSPSPRELYARLSEDEKVAVDLLLQGTDSEEQLAEIITDPKRRDHLRGLTTQFAALGITIGESTALDQECKGWQEAARRYAERREAAVQEREEALASEQQRLQALPPGVRKAVQRHRRRQQRRGEILR